MARKKKVSPKKLKYGTTTVTQLASGNWHAQVYIGKNADGVKQYEPFTDPDPDEVGRLANVFKKKRKKMKSGNLTMEEAVEDYISIRDGIVSPTTIAAYRKYARLHLGDMGSMLAKKVTDRDIQAKVNELAKKDKENGGGKLAPKYIKNVVNFYEAVIRHATNNPDLKFNRSMPEVMPSETYIPTEEELIKLIAGTAGTELSKAIILAICINDRRGQVCGLKGKYLDRKNSTIYSKEALVYDEHNNLVTKAPKSGASAKVTEVPEIVFDLLGQVEPEEYVVDLTPDRITAQFAAAIKRLGLPYFTFHTLRHFNASIFHAMNIPEQYAQKRGGWATPYTMRNVYTHTINKKEREVNDKCNAFYDRLLRKALGKEESKVKIPCKIPYRLKRRA